VAGGRGHRRYIEDVGGPPKMCTPKSRSASGSFSTSGPAQRSNHSGCRPSATSISAGPHADSTLRPPRGGRRGQHDVEPAVGDRRADALCVPDVLQWVAFKEDKVGELAHRLRRFDRPGRAPPRELAGAQLTPSFTPPSPRQSCRTPSGVPVIPALDMNPVPVGRPNSALACPCYDRCLPCPTRTEAV
jgi:hypothetical protein